MRAGMITAALATVTLLTGTDAAAVPSAGNTLLNAKVSATGRSAGGCDAADHSFDYMLLVEQWPLEFNEPDPNGVFTLHGMW